MSLFGNWDEMFENSITDLYKFQDVNRLEEIISILKFLRNSEFFIDIANIKEYKKSLFDSGNMGEFNVENIYFFDLAKKSLKNEPIFYFPPLTKFIHYQSLMDLYRILELSYSYDSGHKITDAEIKSIIFSGIVQRVSFFVEDFDNGKILPDFSSDFFKRLSNVYWEDKKAKNLESKIFDVIANILSENSSPHIFTKIFSHCNFFLIACNALKNNRDVVTCDDVVVAYLTTFKILMIDIKSLIPLIEK